MISYNHEQYIRQAIEGVLMQETLFNFELIISDDCSSDNTLEIIKEYRDRFPNIVNIVNREKNLGSLSNFIDTFSYCEGEYIAICEGDDYWIDPLKLQKQIAFLESNKDYGLVYTDSKVYYDSKKSFGILEKAKNRKQNFFEDLISSTSDIYTLTVCFKKELIQKYIKEVDPISKDWLMGDLPLWLFISSESKIHYIDEVSSVYRVLEESASNTKNISKHLAFRKSAFEIRLYFLEKYCPNNLKLKKDITSLYLYEQLVWNKVYNGTFKQFLQFFYHFHLRNNNFRFFIGSFFQFIKKVKGELRSKKL